MPRMTWSEKLANSSLSTVRIAPKNFADIKAGQKMLLPAAKDVAGVICEIPKGKEFDMKALRASLAMKHKAGITCPVVTGIQLRVSVARRRGGSGRTTRGWRSSQQRRAGLARDRAKGADLEETRKWPREDCCAA